MNESIFENPDIYPEKIDLINGNVYFGNMSRKGYLKSPFLDHRIIKKDDVVSIVDLDQLIAKASKLRPMPAHYIFHNAFCCSTYFSRCLNVLDEILVLREPNVLMEQASIYRYAGTQVLPGVSMDRINAIFCVINNLISRRYCERDVVVTKPSDACNNIMDKLLGSNTKNKALLLYSDLDRFLTAILKVPQRADWIRIRLNELCIDEYKMNGTLEVNPRSLSTAQMAAYVWVMQIRKFRALIECSQTDNIRSLNSEVFMARQVESISAFLDFLGKSCKSCVIADHIDNKLARHSKDTDLEYSFEKREQDYQLERNRYAKEVKQGVDWAQEIFGEQVADQLANPLDKSTD